MLSRSADITLVQAVPLDDDWRRAMAEVRAVIADAVAAPPMAADIARELAQLAVVLDSELQNARNEPGARLADDLVRAVDSGETVTSPAGQVAMFAGVRAAATPAALHAATRRLFGATAVRLVVTLPTPLAGGADALTAALAEPVAPPARRSDVAAVTMADLPPLGPPGQIVASGPLPGLTAEQIVLSNGVRVLVSDSPVEPGKVRVNLRFGGGRAALAPGEGDLLWTGDFALVASGVGNLGQAALDALTSGRQLQLQFGIDDDAFELAAETSRADLADQLRLLATKLAAPGWDPAPVGRLRAAMLAGFASQDSTPAAVMDGDMVGWLRGNDPRWAAPDRAAVAGLTPAAFRTFWAARLAEGPVEVQMFGDLAGLDWRAMLAATVGALPPRAPLPPVRGFAGPQAAPAPTVLRHRGDGGQAGAALAWPTGGGRDAAATARGLEVLAAVFNDRLFDRLRGAAGSSYSPSVSSDWPTGFASGGHIVAASLVAQGDTAAFFAAAHQIAADLAAAPIAQDELDRAAGPIRAAISRALTGHVYWMHLLEGATRDARVVAAAATVESDFAGVTPAQLQALARRYLRPDRAAALTVVADPAAPPSTTTAAAPR